MNAKLESRILLIPKPPAVFDTQILSQDFNERYLFLSSATLHRNHLFNLSRLLHKPSGSKKKLHDIGW